MPLQTSSVFPPWLKMLIADIVFLSEFSDVNESTITNYEALGKAGNEKMTQLIDWLVAINATGAAKSTASTFSAGYNAMLITSLVVFVSAIVFFM